MPWSGKFKNGESFTDLTDDELNRFESEIDPASVSEIVDSTKLPSLPEVPSDTPVDYSFVGFANPTTLPKAQKAAEQVMAEQEPGYFSNAYNYVAGEEQTDPNLLGRVWKGASQSALYEHPFETGAGIAAGLFAPMSLGGSLGGPIAQMAITGGSVGAGNVLDQALLDSDTTRTWKERTAETAGSTIGAGLLSGLGYWIASGMKNYAAPYLKAVADYGAKSKAVQAFRDWLSEIPKEKAAYELGMLRSLGTDPANLRVSKIRSLLSEAKPGEDILSLIRNNKEIGDAVAEQVGYKMIDEIPAHRVFGPPNLEGMSLEEALVASRAPELPSKWNIGQYILENTEVPQAVRASDYVLPDWLARYAQRKMPFTGILGEATPLGGMARGIGDYVAPRILPTVDYLAPAVSKGLGSAGGVTGGIIGSESTRSVQDLKKDLESRFEMPPVY